MLPIDEDILQTRYGDDPMATEWYQNWRKLGAQPDEAIRATEIICRLRDKLFPHLSQAQFRALERYADACARAFAALHGIEQLQSFQPPSEQECAAFVAIVRNRVVTAPMTPEQIKRLADEAQQAVALVREHLSVRPLD